MTREEAKGFLIDISYKLGNMAIEYLTEKDGEKMREAIKTLEQEPKPKMGHWIYKQYGGYPECGNWHCSECDELDNRTSAHCPNCGATMVEPQERSDKE